MDRVAIEHLFVDYYSQIGSSTHDYSRFFASDATLQVNGFIVNGNEEIEALYQQVDGDADAAPPLGDDAVPPGSFQMLFSKPEDRHYRRHGRGDSALAKRGVGDANLASECHRVRT